MSRHTVARRTPLCFAAVVRIRGVNPYVHVSAARAGGLRSNWRTPMPVSTRINGHPRSRPWRINMMPAGDGSFYLYLHNSVRAPSGVRVGDRVTVELAFDSTYRNGPQHAMPRWFSGALRQDAAAKLNWRRLTPSRRKELLRYFANLKSDAARQRNLARALRVLGGAPGRFMGRSWSDGR